jgi:magnesium-transporting ATPase (P-type)
MNTLDKIKNINVEILKIEKEQAEANDINSPCFINFKCYVFFTFVFCCFYYFFPTLIDSITNNTLEYVHAFFISTVLYAIFGLALMFGSIGDKIESFIKNKIGKDGESFFVSIIVVLCPILNFILIFLFVRDLVYIKERKYIRDEELIKKESDDLKKELCKLKKEKKKLERKVIEDSLLLSKILKLNSKNKIRIDIENKIKKIYEKENIIERHIKERKLNSLEIENI